MKEQKTKRVSIFTILIMVLCGLLLAYTIYSFISVHDYLKNYAEAYGAITFSEKFSYYMSNCFTYIIYIFIFLAIWWVKPRNAVKEESKNALTQKASQTIDKKELESDKAKDADTKEVDTKETKKTFEKYQPKKSDKPDKK